MITYVFKVLDAGRTHTFTTETRTIDPDTLSEVGRHAADVASGFKIGLPVTAEGGQHAGTFRVVGGGVTRGGVRYTWSGGAQNPPPAQWPAHCTDSLTRQLEAITGSHLRLTVDHLTRSRDAAISNELVALRSLVDGTASERFWPSVGLRQLTEAWKRELRLAEIKAAIESPNYSHTRAGNPACPGLVGIYHRDKSSPTGCLQVECFLQDDVEATALLRDRAVSRGVEMHSGPSGADKILAARFKHADLPRNLAAVGAGYEDAADWKSLTTAEAENVKLREQLRLARQDGEMSARTVGWVKEALGWGFDMGDLWDYAKRLKEHNADMMRGLLDEAAAYDAQALQATPFERARLQTHSFRLRTLAYGTASNA